MCSDYLRTFPSYAHLLFHGRRLCIALSRSPSMRYDGNSPACTRTCKRVQASNCGMEMESVKRYGVSWSPPGPCSISRRFFSSKLKPMLEGAPVVLISSRKDEEVVTVAPCWP